MMANAQQEEGGQPELAFVATARVECEDCGHSRQLWPAAIQQAMAQGVQTVLGLHKKLRCSICYERGGTGKNINVFPTYRRRRS